MGTDHIFGLDHYPVQSSEKKGPGKKGARLVTR